MVFSRLEIRSKATNVASHPRSSVEEKSEAERSKAIIKKSELMAHFANLISSHSNQFHRSLFPLSQQLSVHLFTIYFRPFFFANQFSFTTFLFCSLSEKYKTLFWVST